jgi:ATP adenylyltransferase
MEGSPPDRPPSVLFAPWRMGYIKGLSKPPASAGGDACFLCEAATAGDEAQCRDRLVLWTTDHSVVLLNRYPYANGHVMVAPRAHHADVDLLSAAEQADLMAQTAEVVKLLRRAVSAQGFNVGINLGRCAGAGVPGHLHQHVVPRWAGDISFMSVVGETRVVPEAVSQTYDELVRVRAEMGAGR